MAIYKLDALAALAADLVNNNLDYREINDHVVLEITYEDDDNYTWSCDKYNDKGDVITNLGTGEGKKGSDLKTKIEQIIEEINDTKKELDTAYKNVWGHIGSKNCLREVEKLKSKLSRLMHDLDNKLGLL